MTTPAVPTLGDVLGVGWRFPPAPTGTGHFEMRSGAALVRQSVLVIIGTERGERLMRPDFGCGLRRYLMEPNTPATRAARLPTSGVRISKYPPGTRMRTSFAMT